MNNENYVEIAQGCILAIDLLMRELRAPIQRRISRPRTRSSSMWLELCEAVGEGHAAEIDGYIEGATDALRLLSPGGANSRVLRELELVTPSNPESTLTALLECDFSFLASLISK